MDLGLIKRRDWLSLPSLRANVPHYTLPPEQPWDSHPLTCTGSRAKVELGG